MTKLLVREALPEDDEAVADVLELGFQAGYVHKMRNAVMTDERRRDLRDVAGRRRVATVLAGELEGRIVGTVALYRPGAPGSEAWLEGAADLRALAVHPDFHGRGLSLPLMDAAERLVRETWRLPAVCLHVRRGNDGVARLYTARGYLRDPAGDLEKPGFFLDAYALRF